jgi:hypothetical protein
LAKLDFSSVEDFVPVPEGRYLAEVIKSAEGLSQRAGQRKWSLDLEVREDPQHDGEFIGKSIKWDLSLVAKARWKVLQTIQALGEDVSKEDTEFEFDAESYIGRLCTMVVSKQNDPTYGERTRVLRLDPAEAFEGATA